MDEHTTGTMPAIDDPAREADTVAAARASLEEPGRYLAYDDECGRPAVVALEKEWTRIGRSMVADVRFDDPTVSRRHALIVRQPDGIRVVDDRSLNGVYVNGERVEWHMLRDGDEILVGSHVLHFLELLPGAPRPAARPLSTTG